MTSPAATVSAALRYIERCQQRNGRGPAKPKEFSSNGAVEVRIEGTDADGTTLVRGLSGAHRWRLAVFAGAMRLRVRVEGMEE